MASTFTWLDYSEHERRKMLDVIELFGERTTRDELGLGGVTATVASSSRRWAFHRGMDEKLNATTFRKTPPRSS